MNQPFDHIDGSTPIPDVSGLIPDIGFQHQLNEHEAANVLDAVLKHLRPNRQEESGPDFDLTWMKQVHQDMFCRVWKWAGKLRKVDLTIGVPWGQVEARLYNLAESVPHFKNPPGPDDIAHLHHQLVLIHPFENGNGRWSRLVANVFQLRMLGTFTDWPPEVVGETQLTSPIRAEYITSLKAADARDLSQLVALHERYTTVFPEL